MKYQYAQLDSESQKEFVSINAVDFVQNQAPCQNMSFKRAKWLNMKIFENINLLD